MVKVDTTKWNQSPEALRRLAMESPHRRTRERNLALYEITQGTNATQVALGTGRNHQTEMSWVRKYNICGPEKMQYYRTGGNPPFFQK